MHKTSHTRGFAMMTFPHHKLEHNWKVKATSQYVAN